LSFLGREAAADTAGWKEPKTETYASSGCLLSNRAESADKELKRAVLTETGNTYWIVDVVVRPTLVPAFIQPER